MNNSVILLIDTCNYIDFPIGGQLIFSRQMMKVFGNRLVLSGLSTDETPVGQWSKKRIDGLEYDFFAFARVNKETRKPIVPIRLKEYYGIKKYKKNIQERGIKNVFVRSQHLFAAIVDWEWDNLCYQFPGTENPLAISRYAWAKPFSDIFDRWFLPKVARANTILAAADDIAVKQLVQRSRGVLNKDKIIHFATRVDTDIFSPKDKVISRKALNLPENTTILVTTGRIHWAKGWQLLLDSFYLYLNKYNNRSLFIFVGDGEDRPRMEAEIKKLGLSKHVIITGYQSPFKVAQYLNVSDIFVLGSEKEGWCTSLVEALAMQLPIVSTNVSSASSIVKDGINGYVLQDRNPENFAHQMIRALQCDHNQLVSYSLKETEKYALRNLARDLGDIWKPLSI